MDAFSKALVLEKLAGHPPVKLLHGLITLGLTFNAGAAFGLGTSPVHAADGDGTGRVADRDRCPS